ncbi:hypothetical protein [Georgenia ruanii]|uniref:hypothetical protein n=1 Tax=Georgenia ruanii TaxID=348442 RepID=UPI00126561DD|nr:hypothetical protein [Georgenia ruanii]
MEGLTSIALGAGALWGLYWVVRSGVKGGLLDAAREWERTARRTDGGTAREDDAAGYTPGAGAEHGRARPAPRPPLDTLA